VPAGEWFVGVTYDDANDLCGDPDAEYKGTFGYYRDLT